MTPTGIRLRVATFNIRNGRALDGRHAWPRRRGAAVAAIADLDADVVGLQEAYPWQLRWLLGHLASYKSEGVGRNRRGGGEACPVLYRADRLAGVRATTRWFGDEPEVPGSRAPGARFPRIATIVVGDTAGVRVQVVNVHLDAQSAARRERGASQLLGWLDPTLPHVVLGDLNAPPNSPVLELLGAGGLRSALDANAGGTAHRYTGRTDGPRIDHILVSRHWTVLDAEVAARPAARPLPSDHWPVVATLLLGRG